MSFNFGSRSEFEFPDGFLSSDEGEDRNNRNEGINQNAFGGIQEEEDDGSSIPSRSVFENHGNGKVLLHLIVSKIVLSFPNAL